MKDVIEKLEIILNQGLYGRDEEVRLALLCTLSNKPLLLYGHDDAKDIQMRFEALFGETPIKAKITAGSNLSKNKDKLSKYTAYCCLGNHNNTEHLYDYLFAPKNTNVIEKLKQLAPEANKLKTFFQDYNFTQFWDEENRAKAINFIESLASHANPTGELAGDIAMLDDAEQNLVKQLSNISDKRFKDFLHLLAVNLIINNRKEITPIDFGMFYYCLRDWSDGVRYLETTICASLSNDELPTFVFHDEEYEKTCKETFFKSYEQYAFLIPNLEYMVYVPYSSSPSIPANEIFVRLDSFYTQFQNLVCEETSDDIAKDMQEVATKENILKDAQLKEMELKETQLAQVQLKRSAFKSVKDALDERLKIANAKESEFREQREILESKYKDAKTTDRREGLESQIAEVQAKEDQFKEIRLNLEAQLQDAKNTLEDKLKQTKEILEEKLQEVKAKELDLKEAQDKLNQKLTNRKGNMDVRIKEGREYLTQLRTLPVNLNKAVDACRKQIDAVSKPNPIWANPLKIHLAALYKIQKNLPNMIKAFDSQVKKYEEHAKQSTQTR
ncbi:hypothetical protein [Helicobacter bilis]|uniref:hypothetical protein n=1 Tax=Helicobacter bilis TaxID=37372 RepID=UPI000CF074CE|nr:hypothetical protein [Helicobacter bilis]